MLGELDAANSSSGSWDATCQEKTNNTRKKQDKNYTWFGQYCLRPQSTPIIAWTLATSNASS
jgi:hypothetical protein